MNALVRPADVVARIGGDEFAILLRGTTPEGAVLVAERIVELLPADTRAWRNGRWSAVNCSVGIAAGEGDEALDHLLRRADEALYHAKRAGKNRWTLARAEDVHPTTARNAHAGIEALPRA